MPRDFAIKLQTIFFESSLLNAIRAVESVIPASIILFGSLGSVQMTITCERFSAIRVQSDSLSSNTITSCLLAARRSASSYEDLEAPIIIALSIFFLPLIPSKDVAVATSPLLTIIFIWSSLFIMVSPFAIDDCPSLT